MRLEAELGVRLLQRATRHLGLTDAGQRFSERVRGALAEFDEASATARELGSEPRGTIRMTAPPGAAAFGLADAIAAFTRQYPSITVDVEMSPRMVELVSEGFDLALRAGRLADSSLIARKVGTTDLALLASPTYLKRRGRPGSPSELTDHDCVLFRGRNGRASWCCARTTAKRSSTYGARSAAMKWNSSCAPRSRAPALPRCRRNWCTNR